MTKFETVRKYVSEHPTPDQRICPVITQYWKNSKGMHIYQNIHTGERFMTENRIYHDTISPMKIYLGAYINYVPELGMLEIAKIMVAPNGRGKEGERHEWTFVNRMFSFRDSVAYDEYGAEYNDGMYYSKTFMELLNDLGHSQYHCNCHNLAEIGNTVIPDSFKGESVSIWHFKEWVRVHWFIRPKTDMRKAADYEFEAIGVETAYPQADERYVVIFKILDEHYCVFRVFNETRREFMRIFVDHNGKPVVSHKTWGCDLWKLAAQIRSWTVNETGSVYLTGDSLEDWKPIKYIKDIIDWHHAKCLQELIVTLRHPIIETLIKSGYSGLAYELSSYNEVAANLKNYLYSYKEGSGSLYKILGVNKHILKAVEEVGGGKEKMIIHDLKQLYGESEYNADISTLSKETVDLAVKGLAAIAGRTSLGAIAGREDHRIHAVEWLDISPAEKADIEKLFRMRERTDDFDAVAMYADIVKLYYRLPDAQREEIDIHNFDSPDSMRRLHDSLVVLTNQLAEYRGNVSEATFKKFEKLQEERIEKFEKKGDKFSIILPKMLGEITTEGQVLNHCVGGYLDRHAQGYTTIMFLRKNEALSTPFYTIEVDNNNTIVQIHGKHNRWLGNDPEAIPFVYEWISERGLQCSNRILLSTATGYHNDGGSLDESYLTKQY